MPTQFTRHEPDAHATEAAEGRNRTMSPPPTRRQVLTAAAATTGAWITPSILTIDRVGAVGIGSCVDLTLDWNAEVGILNEVTAPIVVNGTTVTVTNTTSIANSAVISPTNNFVTPFGTVFGGQNSWYEVAMGDFVNTGTYPIGSTVDVTFTFSPNVFDLAFTLFDVDRSNGNFLDLLTFTAFAGGTTGPVLVANNPAFVSVAGLSLTGLQPATDASSAANVTVSFPGRLTSFSINYTAGDPGGDNILTSQAYGVSNMMFCGQG